MKKDELQAIYFSFFDQLKPEHAEKAKANYEHDFGDGEPKTHDDAVSWGFDWEASPEGDEFWVEINYQLEHKTYPLQLTPQVCKDKAKAHLYGKGKMPAHEWFKYLKPEHKEAAMKLGNDTGVEGELFECLADALFSKNWFDSSKFCWGDIHDALKNGTYHAESAERMATPEDMEQLEERVKDATRPLPSDAAERKTYPIYSGFITYFPNAIAAVSHLSYLGNQQHHPEKPLHWDKEKSSDERDALMRHVIDGDWEQVCWRALANLERKLTGTCNYEK